MFKQSVPLGSTTEIKRKPHESLSTVCTVRFHNWKKQKLHCAHLGEVIRRDFSTSLPPANEVCEGYVFTPVCHSVYRGEEYLGRYTSPCPPLPLGQVHPPRSSACWEIRATSRRYASYWNAFLLSYAITRMLATIVSRLFVKSQFSFHAEISWELKQWYHIRDLGHQVLCGTNMRE